MDERKFDDFLEKLFKLESAVQRLTEHESLDRSRRDERYKDISERLVELEKMRGELTLTAMHNLTAEEARNAIRTRLDELVNGKLGALDDRQRAMERTLWRASGAATVVISLVVIVVNVLVKHL
jgi:hypothetical protein